MKPDIRKFLIQYYKPHNGKLSEFLYMKFNWDN